MPQLSLTVNGSNVAGQALTLRCSIITNPLIPYDTSYSLVITGPSSIIGPVNGSLLDGVIDPLRTSDAGTYTCVAPFLAINVSFVSVNVLVESK